MLSESILTEYMNCFYGYGSYGAAYWFVGTEEYSTITRAEFELRLDVWNARGKRELEDIQGYHIAIGKQGYFAANAVLNKTWDKLIQVLFRMENLNGTREQRRAYQKIQLARDNKVCLLDLLPLPRPGGTFWEYNQWSNAPSLADRKAYKTFVLLERKKHLAERIQAHHPRAVIFYGQKYREHWEEIARSRFAVTFDGYESARVDATWFFLIKHPIAQGLTNEYFKGVGRFIADKLCSAKQLH